MTQLSNPELELARSFLQKTNQNIFLTGKAGTGKTTFLRELRFETEKRMVVVAPTGVAAINAGGVTIHSFFQISFGPQIPSGQQSNDPRFDNQKVEFKRFNREKINIIKSLDLLVIDEISMVRADVLDAIDAVLCRFKDRYKPFGGVQLLMIGDIQQLAPVVKDDEWSILRNYYENIFFFSSHALKQSDFLSVELKTIYRQTDQKFIGLLNKVRQNAIDEEALQILNSRVVPDFKPARNDGFITLTTHNSQADKINRNNLEDIKNQVFRYKANIEGDFPEYSYPTESFLELKVGAQVMFIKNDASYEKQYYNGKIGEVVACDDGWVEVKCPGDRSVIRVENVEWQNAKFSLNNSTNEIEEKVVGRFFQIPLKLAWAITIHKSQGLTFEKAIIDARQSFAHGQVYVALSRCQTLEGMVLSTPIDGRSIKNDNSVVSFTSAVEANPPTEQQLMQAQQRYELQLINDLFDFKPMIRLVKYCLKIWNENEQYLIGNLPEKLLPVADPIQHEMIAVADRFGSQAGILLQNGLIELNEELHGRIVNGIGYFQQKLESTLVSAFEEVSFQTDNKSIKSLLKDGLEKLEQEITVKSKCFTELKSGFNIQKYLYVRALAAIDSPKLKSKRPQALEQTNHPEFFKMLLDWRSQKADELNVTVSRVLSQKVLVNIADELPPSAKELKAIKGMGGKKIQQFGSELLQMIIDFRSNSKMEIPLGAAEDIEQAGMNTKDLSFFLFKSGKDIREISKERKLAVTTIESHLAYFVSIGELDVFKLVDKKVYGKISDVASSNQFLSLSDVKKQLPEEITYTQIKMVMADLGKY